MNTNEILSHIDSLLKESRLDEAEKYMKATLSDAEKSDRPDIMLTLYNELAGFYRDCGRFAEALESCRRSEELLEKMNIGGAQLASALLNSANACRAAGLYDESFDYYRRIYAILENIGAEKPLYASYYNNLALLYQETNNWQEAADCLKKPSPLQMTISAGRSHAQILPSVSQSLGTTVPQRRHSLPLWKHSRGCPPLISITAQPSPPWVIYALLKRIFPKPHTIMKHPCPK